MASGVSMATIPTMAGMVAALSGIAMSTYLKRRAERERELLGDRSVNCCAQLTVTQEH